MNDLPTGHASRPPERRFDGGIDDILIVPLAATAFAVRSLLRGLLRLLIRLLDYAFPILLQVARFPLFTLRIFGDGLAAIARGVIAVLPVGGDKRAAWREQVSRAWAWLRARISYKAFEEWIHHLFEDGMAWVFRTCRTLTPLAALLVLTGAIIWLPLSFAIATGLHAVLFAKAAVWPAWLQLLHPVATVIAKSKLLVLPVYPAAWPQARQHPVVRTLMAFASYIASLRVMRKAVYRYRQTAYAAWIGRRAIGRTADRAGASQLYRRLLAATNHAAASIGATLRRAVAATLDVMSRAPLVGDVVGRYAAHYEAAPEHKEKFSTRMKGFFGRWSIKLSAEYYEAKDREKAAAKSPVPAEQGSTA